MEETTRQEEWKYIILYMVGVLSVALNGVILVGMIRRLMLFVVSWVSMEQKDQVTIIAEQVVQYCLTGFNALVTKYSCGTALTVDGV